MPTDGVQAYRRLGMVGAQMWHVWHGRPILVTALLGEDKSGGQGAQDGFLLMSRLISHGGAVKNARTGRQECRPHQLGWFNSSRRHQ